MSLKYENTQHLESVLVIMITVLNYRASSTDVPHTEYIVFNDSDRRFAIFDEAGNEHVANGYGQFLSVSSSRNELTPSSSQVSLSISGIPNSSLWQILNNPMKGSQINIWRAFYHQGTEDQIVPGQLDGRFYGTISHYSIQDTTTETSATSVITLICDNLAQRTFGEIRGRQTNSQIQKILFPNDTSFDRVSSLVGSAYNFGAV